VVVVNRVHEWGSAVLVEDVDGILLAQQNPPHALRVTIECSAMERCRLRRRQGIVHVWLGGRRKHATEQVHTS
jgi:hypothetical protein